MSADEGNRAGPTLAGIFGRRIATLPGYNFSEALKKLDIVWTPETVSKLFEVGPMAYTPGTKMPEQRIGSAEDRAALVTFLEKATNGQGERIAKIAARWRTPRPFSCRRLDQSRARRPQPPLGVSCGRLWPATGSPGADRDR